MSPVRVVATAQLGPTSSAQTDTVARMVSLVERALASGVELVVFPELSLTPYFPARSCDVLEFSEASVPPERIASLIAAAAGRIDLVVPFAEHTAEGVYNTAALLARDGRELGRYRKMHIPGPRGSSASHHRGEKHCFRPGDLGFPAYQAAVGRVGMAICFDRRFPETFRCLALNGAELFAVGYNTSAGSGAREARVRLDAHELAIRSGAAANGIPLIAAGKAGVEDGIAYLGASSVISHTGEVLARASSDGDELVVAEVDLDTAAAYRDESPVRMDRRPEQYSAITRPVVATPELAGRSGRVV